MGKATHVHSIRSLLALASSLSFFAVRPASCDKYAAFRLAGIPYHIPSPDTNTDDIYAPQDLDDGDPIIDPPALLQADWVDRHLYAILHKPQVFQESTLLHFNGGSGMMVAWDTDARNAVEAIGKVSDSNLREFYSARGFPQYTWWRLIPVMSGPTQYLFEHDPEEGNPWLDATSEYYLINEFIGHNSVDGDNKLTMWGLGTNNYTDGTSAMVNVLNGNNLPYLRRAVVTPSMQMGRGWGALEFNPQTVQNAFLDEGMYANSVEIGNDLIGNTGLRDTELVGRYDGLESDELRDEPMDIAPHEKVYANVCALFEGSQSDVENAKANGELDGTYYYSIALTKGRPMPVFSRPHDSASLSPSEWGEWYVCSPATLMVKVWPV
ncbi:hypothetical protein DRE_02704 [Drechslerella stenobrocha 248]|uniref:Enterotoxin n=1 Tax=Drechslerella stenobrocha 248 TaxID=1043628 RepID=W7IG23_9PEZI|nr:hypothetical protein DRE_02704 [Drechslerella stenobrocha 248]